MWTFFAWLGLVTFVIFLYETLLSPIQLLYHKWLEYNGKAIPLREKYGNWAAVTGCTDGIGKAYAKQLARCGLNIVLISRSQTKLEQVAKEIENEYGVETFIIQADFAKGPEVYKHLFNELAKKPIRIVVNNVGIGHNPPGMVSSFTPQHLCDMIHVNVMAAVLLSRHFVDKWLSQDVKGCIVNISSCLEICAVPYGAVYGASKAFIRSFTVALQHEVQHYDITVQLLSPAFVATKINDYSDIDMRGNFLMPQAEEYAKVAISTLGKTSMTTGYFWHGVQATFLQMLPSRLGPHIFSLLAKYLVNDLTKFKKNK